MNCRVPGVLLVGLVMVMTESAPAAPSDSGVLLRSGDSAEWGRLDWGPLAGGTDDPRIVFTEVGGARIVARMTAVDAGGDDVGAGRVLVVLPHERRTVSLLEELGARALEHARLRIEILDGEGRASVSALEAFGSPIQVRPDAAESRRRAVRRVAAPVLPTSGALIDAAEAAGSITAETALLYRVYALFGDARLPPTVRGDDRGLKDSMYMLEVRDRFETLSEETQAAVLPFLRPPSYSGSWAESGRSDVRAAIDPPPCDLFSDEWAFVDAANSPVRVWYRVELPDALNASRIASLIDTQIWTKFAGLMKRSPISDDAESCNGGNGRLDLYLTDIAREGAVSYISCLASPVFVLLSRSSTDSTVAHEVFHAFQVAFPIAGCRTFRYSEYRWWHEASANWAIDFALKNNNGEHVSALDLVNYPEQPLDFTNDKHEYGAYLLPFYIHRKTGDPNFVRIAWESCATEPALEALDRATPGGFEAVWPEFARFNWNRDPVTEYQTWDSFKYTAQTPERDSISVTTGARMDQVLPIAAELPRLSATYKHYKFLDDNTRTVMFWNGTTWDIQLQDRPLGGVQHEPHPAPSEAKKGGRVQALIKIGGQWSIEDWTDLPFRSYCRDLAAERIDELVLVFSNSEFRQRDRKLEPPGEAPFLWTSNMGCWKWKGTVTYADTGVAMSTAVTWTRAEQSQTAPSISYVAEGTETWSISGMCSGSGTLPIQGFNVLTSYNFITPAGSFRRSYVGAGEETRLVGVNCGNFSTQTTLPAWLLTPLQPFQPGIPYARFVTVNASGSVMDGSHQILPGVGGTWKWHFEAQREP